MIIKDPIYLEKVLRESGHFEEQLIKAVITVCKDIGITWIEMSKEEEEANKNKNFTEEQNNRLLGYLKLGIMKKIDNGYLIHNKFADALKKGNK